MFRSLLGHHQAFWRYVILIHCMYHFTLTSILSTTLLQEISHISVIGYLGSSVVFDGGGGGVVYYTLFGAVFFFLCTFAADLTVW
jgi:hypothetical protein